MELFLKSIKRKHNTDNSTTKTRNKGFSLIEVLVAMVILAIITLPILSSFASAAKVNSNARKQENANTVAQKIIEEFKSLPITQLTNGNVTTGTFDSINNSATGVAKCTNKTPEAASLVPMNQLIYQFDMASFDGSTPKTYASGGAIYPYYEGANGERYFVKVTLDPSSYADKSSAGAAVVDKNVSNNINTYNMPVLSDVNTDSNYVIMQQVYQHDASMINAFKVQKGVDITTDDLRREVTITSEVTTDGTMNAKIIPNGASTSVQIYKQNLVVEVKYVITKPGADIDKSITYVYDTSNTSTFAESTRIIENATEINQINGFTNANAYNELKNVYLFYRAFDKVNFNAKDFINVKYIYPIDATVDIKKDKLNVYIVEQNVTSVNKLDKNNVKVNINGLSVLLNSSGTLGLGNRGTVDIYSNIDGWDKFVTTAANQKNSITQNVSAGDGTKYLYNILVEIWVGEKTGDPFMTMTSTKEN